ncbi:MAG: oxidoreductase [Candidatus Nanopelagicales bacterium]
MTDPFSDVAALPGVAAVADRARKRVDGVMFERVLLKRAAEVVAECRLEAARSSAELEGAPASLADLRSGTAFSLDSVGPVASAAVRVAEESTHLVDVWSRAPAQALARLHAVAAADLAGEPGRPRDDAEVHDRLRALLGLLVQPTTAPGVVVAAIVHGELLALAPFGSRDGLVARAAWRLVLVSRGVDSKSVTVPEQGLVRLGRPAYAESLAAYRSSEPAGVAAWVAHCCAAIELGAARGLELCREVAARSV